jgi:hypothetical protein
MMWFVKKVFGQKTVGDTAPNVFDLRHFIQAQPHKKLMYMQEAARLARRDQDALIKKAKRLELEQSS